MDSTATTSTSASFNDEKIFDDLLKSIYRNEIKRSHMEKLFEFLCRKKRWRNLGILFGSFIAVLSLPDIQEIIKKCVESGASDKIILALFYVGMMTEGASTSSSTSKKQDKPKNKRKVGVVLKEEEEEEETDQMRFQPSFILREFFSPQISCTDRASRECMVHVFKLLQICLDENSVENEGKKSHEMVLNVISFLSSEQQDGGRYDRYSSLEPEEIPIDTRDFFISLATEKPTNLSCTRSVVPNENCPLLPPVSSVENTYSLFTFAPEEFKNSTMQYTDRYETVLVLDEKKETTQSKIFAIVPENKVSTTEDVEVINYEQNQKTELQEIHIIPDMSENHIPKIDPLSWNNIENLCKQRNFYELTRLFGYSVRYNIDERKSRALFQHLIYSKEVSSGIIWSLIRLRNDQYQLIKRLRIATYAPFCLLRSYFSNTLSNRRSTNLASLVILKLFLVTFYTDISSGETLKDHTVVFEALYFVLFLPNFEQNQNQTQLGSGGLFSHPRNFYAFASLQLLREGDDFQKTRADDRYSTIEEDIHNIVQSLDEVLSLIDEDDLLKHEVESVEEDEEGVSATSTTVDEAISEEQYEPFCNAKEIIFSEMLENYLETFVLISSFLENFMRKEGPNLLILLQNINSTLSNFAPENEKLLQQLQILSQYLSILASPVVDFFKLDELPLSIDEKPHYHEYESGSKKNQKTKSKNEKWATIFEETLNKLGKPFYECNTAVGQDPSNIFADHAAGVEVVQMNKTVAALENHNDLSLNMSFSFDFLHHDLDKNVYVLEDADDWANHHDAVACQSTFRLPALSEEARMRIRKERENITAIIDILADSLREMEVKKNKKRKGKQQETETFGNNGIELLSVQTHEPSLSLPLETLGKYKSESVVALEESDDNRFIYNFLSLPKEAREAFVAEMDDSSKVSWTEAAQVVSACINTAVHLLEHVVHDRVSAAEIEIETAGKILKESIAPPSAGNNSKVDKNGNKVLTYSGTAREASKNLREQSKSITFGLRDTATSALVGIADKFEESQIRKNLIPQHESLEILSAAGNVALSGLGAAQNVYDMMLTKTESVAIKTNIVAADVARHRWGNNVGKICEDTGETIYNTFRAVKFMSMINHVDMTSAVARNTGKLQCSKIHTTSAPSAISTDHLKEPILVDSKLLVENKQAASCNVEPVKRTINTNSENHGINKPEIKKLKDEKRPDTNLVSSSSTQKNSKMHRNNNIMNRINMKKLKEKYPLKTKLLKRNWKSNTIPTAIATPILS